MTDERRNGDDRNRERLLGLLELMVLIRAFEPEAERQYKAAKIGGYCHLASGQEAAHVGAVAAMRDDDVLIAAYRDHGLALARGVDPKAVMAELFGRVDGCAHGRGGSMHLLDVGRGYLGGWGIVGGHLPVATGVAMELARRGERRAGPWGVGGGAGAGRPPAVLEAMTYRYRGHSVADAGLSYRSKEEIAEQRRHDPVERV